jgi:serine/threonine-protein kinase
MAIKYEILNRRPFKQGGLAELELCELRTGRTALVRKLQEHFKFNRQIRSRFVKGMEARMEIGRHENISWSYEMGREGLLPFELLDYVPGVDLSELLRDNPLYVKLRGIEMLLQVAQAILHCHEKNVVHLDIKAANIIVDISTPQPTARLTDFDLALPADTGKAGKKIRMGTFNYMPPEMLVDGEVSPHADIFAFGVLAYNLFSGGMPYVAHNAAESRQMKLDPAYKVKRLSMFYPEAPRQFVDLVHRCIDPRRDYRGTMKSVVKELCQIIALQAIAAMTV